MRTRTPRALALLAALVFGATGCLATLANGGPVYNPGTDTHTDEPASGPLTCDEQRGTHYTEFETGEYIVDVANTVVENLCLTDGYISIRADNVTVQNSTIVGFPSSPHFFWNPVTVEDGSDNALVRYNVIDCGPASTGTPIASQGIRSPDGLTSGFAHNNEIRDCTDGIQAASNWTYSYNYIHRPDNTDESHADGVQWDTESDLSPIHDMVFEWNTVRFPLASASFQYHSNLEPTQGSYNVVVRYNSFWGGTGGVRIPRYGNGGNEFYGNWMKRMVVPPADPFEAFACSTSELGTASIDVWGAETGNTDVHPLHEQFLTDDNVNEETMTVMEREDCG